MARSTASTQEQQPAAPLPASSSRRAQGQAANQGVVRSSLELVFSYSRSQQRFSHGLPSAPSFVDYQWGPQDDGEDEEASTPRGWDPETGYGSHGGESGIDSGDEYHDDESVNDIFPTDPVRYHHDRRASGGNLPTLNEVNEEVSPRTASSALPSSYPTALSLPGKRGGLMTFFSASPPVVHLSSSAGTGSSGSQTPRPPIRLLPDVETGTTPTTRSVGIHPRGPVQPAQSDELERGPSPTEGTPLLRKTPPTKRPAPLLPAPAPLRARRPSALSAHRPSKPTRPSEIQFAGTSGDGQSLFNAVAVLVGIGLLSMPLAFSYAGWIGGTIMLVGFSYICCHTAKLLARLMFADIALNGYTDIGRKAFGPMAGAAINVLFCTELFALGVALVVLFGDSLEVVLPYFSADTYKLIGFLIVLPTTFMPLSYLSIPSLLSSLATVLLVGIILFDGFYKTEAPGSIIDPMPTRWGPETQGMNWLGGIGLVLAGFGGHAVIPSIARDMKHPQSADRVFNTAFLIAGAIAFLSGAAGYLMIGDTVSDEITRDLMQPKYHYPRALNIVAVWMIVVNPVTKFGLCSRPLNIAVEGFLNLAPAPVAPPVRERRFSMSAAMNSTFSTVMSHAGVSDYLDDDTATDIPKSPMSFFTNASLSEERNKGMLRIVSRTIITAACTATAILLPGFEKVMAFLGSFSAFLICVILPIGFYLRLGPQLVKEGESEWAQRFGRVVHIVTLVICIVLMTCGTLWAFLPGTGRVRDD